MKHSPLRSARISAFLALALLGFVLPGPAGWPVLHAQAAPAAAKNQPSSSSVESAQGNDQDEYAVYRHSASVQALGRWLHLDTETASKLFEFLNFAVLFGIILVVLIQRLPKLLRGRRETLQKQLVDARSATEQADARLAAVEKRLSHLDQEIATIRAQAERESAEDEARIKASMEDERQRIVQSAEQEIEAAGAAAQRALKRFAGDLAIERAAGRISLTEENDRVLIREFARDLGRKDSRKDWNGGRN